MRAGGKPSIRPYTPTSRIHERGQFELIVKSYPTGKVGRFPLCFVVQFSNVDTVSLVRGSVLQVSKWLSEIPEGTEVPFKGPIVKFGYRPNQWDAVGMIAGGSGITPMYQLIQVCGIL